MSNSSTIPGPVLRARRQELGLTLDEVADRTRIRRTYLEALEEDRTDAFPGEAYRIGFLRTYAGLLGLKLEKVNPSESVQPAPKPPQPSAKPAQSPARSAPSSAAGTLRGSNSSPMATPMAKRGGRSSRPPRGKGIYAFAVAVVLAAGAIISASLLQGPDPEPAPIAPPAPIATTPPPPPVPAPAPAPAAPVPEEVAPAEGAPGEAVADGTLAAEGSPSTPAPAGTAPAAGVTAPVTEGAKPQGATEAAPPETAQEPPPIAAPSKVNVLRLQALGTNRLELILDNRAPQSYEVKTDTQLSWKVRRSALIRVDDPATVKLWFGDKAIDLNGRTQILVQAGSDPGRQ